MGRTRFSGPVKSTDGFEVGAAASGMTAETNTKIIGSGANLFPDATMTEGTGRSGATGEVVKHAIYKIGEIIITQIMIDVTGLNDGGTAGDIIGKDGGTANCHFGQITAAVNGTVWGGEIRCFETPAGGDPDIDVYSATEATGAQDAAITGFR